MNEQDKKRLLYRANYRGFKEADILLGGFLKENVGLLSDQELADFEALLEARDHDIYAWITGAQPLPPQYSADLIDKIRAYRPEY